MESNGIKVYIGNCEGITEGEIRDEFSRFGRIENVWLARNPPGFAFCWYSDDRDASDAVRAMDGKNLCGKTLRVEISHNRPPRKDRDNDRGYDRYADRDRYSSRSSGGGYGRPPPTSRGGPPRKTGFKVRLSNMPINTHWTELKDYMRKVGDVIYTNTENGEGIAEFADREGMERACKELDDTLFGDRRIVINMQDESDRYRRLSRSPRRSPGYVRGGGRSLSPPMRRRSRSPVSYRGRSRSRSPRYY